MYELIHFLDIALIFIAYNCTQSHKGRPQNHQKRPIYVVKHQVRDLARPYNLCNFSPHLIRFHMGYGPSS